MGTPNVELLHVIRTPGALVRPKRPEPSYPDLPVVDDDGQSSVRGLYLVGEVAGTPLVKLGVNQGHDIVERLAPALREAPAPVGAHDLLVVGAGASGFGAMMHAQSLGLDAVCVESNRFANTIVNMTKGKVLYAEPLDVPVKGEVWFEECTREELLARWASQRDAAGLDIRCHEKVENIQRVEGEDLLEVTTDKQTYRARKVLLAVGKAGNPRKAGVPGEQDHAARISHHLSDPDDFQQQRLVVYGGGDVALEAALRLCGHNKVVLATIDKELVYPKKRNIDALMEQVDAGRIELHLDTRLVAVTESGVVLESQSGGGDAPDGRLERPADHVFEMIGAELPLAFFERVGIRMQSVWTRGQKLALALSLTVIYMLYAVKSSGLVFPFTVWGAEGTDGGPLAIIYSMGGHSTVKDGISGALDAATAAIGLMGHNAWYALLYTVVVAFFGLRAAKRWGKNDPHQRWRFASIIFFQVFFFVFVEVVLYLVLGLGGEAYQKHYWRGWGLSQPFPLFYNSFFWWYEGDPAVLKWFFIGSGLGLTFVGIPLFVRWQGMRFCTWICGCGGLAETLGDTWRHKSPKGERSRLWEFQATLILIWAVGSAVAIALFFDTHGDNGVWKSYNYVVDFWLVAVLPVGFYPFFGGKIWCRYWCPLANYMKLLSGWFGTLGIESNNKCITCGECSKYCQVGVDVMAFAKNQAWFDNTNSSCIHCGICLTVCPVDVLSFGRNTPVRLDVDQAA